MSEPEGGLGLHLQKTTERTAGRICLIRSAAWEGLRCSTCNIISIYVLVSIGRIDVNMYCVLLHNLCLLTLQYLIGSVIPNLHLYHAHVYSSTSHRTSGAVLIIVFTHVAGDEGACTGSSCSVSSGCRPFRGLLRSSRLTRRSWFDFRPSLLLWLLDVFSFFSCNYVTVSMTPVCLPYSKTL